VHLLTKKLLFHSPQPLSCQSNWLTQERLRSTGLAVVCLAIMWRAWSRGLSAPRSCLRSKQSSTKRFSNLSLRNLPRTYATLTDISSYPKPGESLHGFVLNGTKHVPELELTAILLHHEKTGAEYLHVARDDKTNVFSIGFQTYPPDATGVPHILEHTTLCGSVKYLGKCLSYEPSI
jgi:hypothetical protein